MAESMSLLNQIQTALDQGDYPQMRQLLKQWQQLEPQNPWVYFYIARWYEATEKWEKAEEGYRKLLRVSTIPKIMAQSRQGLERLKQRLLLLEQQAIAAETATPDGEEYGLFILEPLEPSLKKAAAQHFAAVMKMDVYTASLQLPLKSWRLFRTGKLGELRFYANALKQGNINGFCLSLAQFANIQVLQVQSITQLTPDLVVQCTDVQGQTVTLTVHWSDIRQAVEGMLPIFEQSIEKDTRDRTYYKTKILDYAQFYDLHLTQRQIILRFNDQHYQFKQGIPFFTAAAAEHQIEQYSIRRNWNQMRQILTEHLANVPHWSDFKSFANHARDFPELLRKIDPQVYLFRQEEHQDTYWDPAWQLYSSVIFVKTAQDQSAQTAIAN